MTNFPQGTGFKAYLPAGPAGGVPQRQHSLEEAALICHTCGSEHSTMGLG